MQQQARDIVNLLLEYRKQRRADHKVTIGLIRDGSAALRTDAVETAKE